MVRTAAIPQEEEPKARSRIIVTSSRSWTDIGMIQTALDDAYVRLGPFTLVHAGYHGGGEKIACRLVGGIMPIERYPPYEFVPSSTAAKRRDAIIAGNEAMIEAGADLCLAFIGQCTSSHCIYLEIHPSHGVTSCIRLAERAMIPVKRYWTPWLRAWAVRT